MPRQTTPLGPGETPQARQAALSALGFLPDVYNLVSNYQNVQNIPINGVPIQTATIRIPLARPSNFYYGVARVDHRLTANDTVSFRFHFDQSDQPNMTSNTQFGPRFAADQAIRRQNHALSSTHVFSRRFLNEIHGLYAAEFPGACADRPDRQYQQLFHDWRIVAVSAGTD